MTSNLQNTGQISRDYFEEKKGKVFSHLDEWQVLSASDKYILEELKQDNERMLEILDISEEQARQKYNISKSKTIYDIVDDILEYSFSDIMLLYKEYEHDYNVSLSNHLVDTLFNERIVDTIPKEYYGFLSLFKQGYSLLVKGQDVVIASSYNKLSSVGLMVDNEFIGSIYKKKQGIYFDLCLGHNYSMNISLQIGQIDFDLKKLLHQ